MSSQTEDLGFREVEWVSEQLGLDKNTVYRYLNDGRLPGLQLGKKWLIEEDGLRDFLRREQRIQTERRQAIGWSETGIASDDAWSGTITVLFSDMVGSSAIVDQLGDDTWLDVIHTHDRILREQLSPSVAHSEVKRMGDGFMVAFPSATEAVRFACSFRAAVAEQNNPQSGRAVQVRLGLHAGEVRHEAGDLIGRTVFIAAHLTNQSVDGEILVSTVVKDLVEDDAFVFDAGRDVDLKVGGKRRVHGVSTISHPLCE